MQWIQLQLRAPFAAFGSEAIDARGVIDDFPAQSMLTGLVANAMGWTRSMRKEHQRLQERIVFVALWERERTSERTTDYQTVRMNKNDKAWSTRGTPMNRAGGAETYKSSHQRFRDYHADLMVAVALHLAPASEQPTLLDLEQALTKPARTLFIGRKPCVPAAPIFKCRIEAPDVYGALQAMVPPGQSNLMGRWPAGQHDKRADRVRYVTDERNWLSGFHGGARRVCDGRISSGGTGA